MVKRLLKTFMAVLAIAAAATGPARAQGTVQLTLASNNSAMGYATVALHPEYELYDTYTTSSSQDGTKTSMWTYASVTDGAWINTSTESNSSFIVNPKDYWITIHHVTFYNANNQSVEVEPNDGNSVDVQLKNGNVYKDYDCTQLLLSGGITRVEAYGMEMSLPAGVTATETAGVYDVVPGTQVPVAAVAKRHYQLNNWSNNATTDTVTVTVNAAMTLTANFVASPVLTLVANNAQMGRVEIPRHQGNGFLCEFKAADYAGQQSLSGMHEKFYFNTVSVAANSTVWTHNENYSNSISVNPEGFRNERYQCRVVFVGPNGETYEFDFSNNNNNHFAEVYLMSGNTYSDYNCNNLLWEGGVASIECYGPGLILPDGVDQITDNTYSVLAGTQVPVEATAKLRYHFVNWSNNSTEAQTTFTMPATAATLTANFVANPTLTLTATPAHGGSVGFDFTPTPQTLTVNDGTVTNGAVPINPCYLDNDNTRGQHIIPAEQLGLMAGGTLNSITWYVNDESSWSSTSNVNVYLKEVDNTTLTEFVNSDTTLVYTGTLSYADGQMTVTFSRPYTYQGGNLLVGVDNPTAGNYTCRDFFGVEAPEGSSADAHGYYTAYGFLPKSTFNYTPTLPDGVIANTDGTYSVAAGTQFTLKANAAADYTLGSWSNQAEVNANATQTLTMPAADLTIGATFVGQPYTVRMAKGTEEAANWTLASGNASVPGTQVLENVMSGSTLTATYAGDLKVKEVIATKHPEPNEVPLTIEALTDGTVKVQSPQSGMQYTLNGGAKTAMTEASTVITVAVGDKVAFYGNGTNITIYDGTGITGGTAEVKVYGNIMSLVNEEHFDTATTLSGARAFFGLFRENAKLSDASGLLLPATTLTERCYMSMFERCQNLAASPVLPATTLASACYNSMFYNCTSLTTAPELPAPELALMCYYRMFSSCTNLNSVTCLATDISATGCIRNWLTGAGSAVQGTKTFNAVSTAEWPTDDYDGIPSGWTRQNIDN